MEYGNKKGWITGNDKYIDSAYWLNNSYDGKHKVKMLVDDYAFEKNDLSGKRVSIKKGEVYIVVNNVTDATGYPRLKLKSGLYISVLKSFTKWI